MKLSHLSLAVLSAIALAACGGSGSSKHVEDPQPPKPPVTPEQPPKQDNDIEEPEKIVDPTETGVVGKLDFNKESSVGTTHYIRDEKSDFDRVNNPSEETVATSILGVNLNSQNPALTNIALAKLVNEAGLIKAVQFLGNDGKDAPQIDNDYSLQNMNRLNVFIPGNNASSNSFPSGYNTDLTVATDVAKNAEYNKVVEQIKLVDKALKVLAKEKELTAEQAQWRDQLKVFSTKLKSIKDEVKQDRYVGKYYLDGDSQTIAWGDDVVTDDKALGNTPLPSSTSSELKGTFTWSDEEKRITFAPDGTNHYGPQALGLVGMTFKKQEVTGDDETVLVQGTEEQSRSTTRIFGRNFNLEGLKAKYNSYSGANHIVSKTSIDNLNLADINVADLNNLTTYMTNTSPNPVVDFDFGLAVKPMQLKYVQYGRVTGNLNPPEMSDEELADGKTYYKRVPFLKHGDDAAVDTYFYRGPNATTLEQMAALPSGKQLVYTGHALMYGIDNSFHGEVSSAVPNAFGQKSSYGVGNFVTATFDVDAQRVEKGLVYNVWHDPTSHIQVEDAVVSFDGNVFGNTVLGEAQRTYNKSDKADFRASFFGENANEMGGSFNSTTWQERYGAQGDIWGGVFGAKRDVEAKPGLSNQQLGDVPNLTQPVKQPKK